VTSSSSFNLAETLVGKLGNTFLVCERDGRMPAGEEHPLGLYRNDCRHLGVHELTIAGIAPRLLVGSANTGAALLHELTNPDLELADGSILELQSVRLRVERELVDERTLVQRIELRSHARRRLELPLALRLGADFRSVLELRGLAGAGGFAQVAAVAAPGGVDLRAQGPDGSPLATQVRCDPAPATVEVDGAAAVLGFELALAPGASSSIALTFSLRDGVAANSPEDPPPRAAPAGRAAAETEIRSDDELFNRLLRRSLLDLRALRSSLDGYRYYAAGVPWYATLFGRDSIIAALQTLAFDADMAADTLRLLCGRLGTRFDDEHDEEPGKVLHELRTGPAARADLSPLMRYYGTVDATPLLLCLVAEHADWSGSLALFAELRESIDAALAWIDGCGDSDGDGLVDYRTSSTAGLVNQGWKDSWDGVPGADGAPLAPPIALVEAQGYVVRAKREMARLFAHAGDAERAAELAAQAAQLQGRLERLWSPDRGHYGLAIDGDGELSPALGSNQGHLLWAGAVDRARAAAIRDSLMATPSYSGWGIRTLASSEPAYNPVGYHLGTVWPHDNALIAVGLRRYGFDAAFLRVFEGLLDAASHFPGYRLPELFAGFGREEHEDPVPYPVACQPQAWAAGALPYLAQSALGLAPDALERRLRVRRPSLPHWVRRVDVRDLRVGDALVSLTFQRVGNAPDAAVALTDARIDGDLDIVLEIEGADRSGPRGGSATGGVAGVVANV
jgi:glycogen debranching enzyme